MEADAWRRFRLKEGTLGIDHLYLCVFSAF